MENLNEMYRTYIEEKPKELLRFEEFSVVNSIDDNHISVIVKTGNKAIYNHVFKTNAKNNNPEQMAADIYEKLNDEFARSYHIITVFITINKAIFPFKFVTSIDNPAFKIEEAVKKAMFVSKPKQSHNKLKEDQNFLDFKITKGDIIICRRFIYIPNNITDFTKAYETIKEGFTAGGIGTFKHKVKVSFDVSNDITGEELTQEFTHTFFSNDRLIKVKEYITEMTKSFKNETK